MKSKIPTTLILICLFFLGLSLLLYPWVSNWWNSIHASRAIVDYDATLEKLTQEDYDELFWEAEKYNREIQKIDFPFMHYDQVSGYANMLNVDDSGIMGYITIDKIQVRLPIYHGTSEGVLLKGVGHLTGSSLPIGGKSSHTVLSAHRGLPSARLFTDLDRMRSGDRFALYILGRELIYEVDQILTVEPNEVEALAIRDGEDYCTLVTCTPYGVNSHRLLVRGHRITQQEMPMIIVADAVLLPTYAAAPLLAWPFVVILGVATVRRKKYEKIGADADIDLPSGTAGQSL